MKKTILAVIAAGLLVPVVSLAAFWKVGQEVSSPSGTALQDNAYLAGNLVTVSGPISGDLFAAGSTVSVTGKVSGDLFAAGSLVNIAGASAEDVRLAGSNVNVFGTFSGELLAAGAQIVVASDAQIAKDAYLTGAALTFNGKSGGNVFLSGEKVSVNGIVGKDLTIRSSEALVIGPDAVISGNVDYSSPVEASIDPAAKISGKVNFHKVAAPANRDRNPFRAALAGILTTVMLLKFLAMLLVAYLLWYVRRKDSMEVINHALTKFGRSLLRGFLFLVAVPVAALLLLATLIGAPISIFAGFIYAAILILAAPFAVLLASSLLIKRKIELRWYHILLGALVLAVLKIVPVVGWLVNLVVYLAALGALVGILQAKFRR